jgi:3-isopropylmalate/(R)-2-methylmalate dehydratase small subunit
MGSEVITINGRAIPLVGDDIDTDRIIPARFLRCVTFDDLGEHVFEDDRHQTQGNHSFDQTAYQGAKILIVNRNFGCGSSREHAPQAIARWGIEAIVGVSFAEIFFGNCLAMGVPCLTAAETVVKTLQGLVQTDPTLAMTVDVAGLEVKAGQETWKVHLAPGPQQMLVSGTWDTCSQLVAQAEQVAATAAKLPYLQWA